jgi:CubicO group peptidase (beta-lactamase class C family)
MASIHDSTAAGARFSTSKLRRLDAIVQEHIATRQIPGAVVLVACRGEVAYHRAFGAIRAHTAAKAVLRTDTIFWIASMAKPIVAAAVLMLVEDGKVRLDDPVSTFIPEFAEPRMVRVFEPGVLDAALSGGIGRDPPHTLVPALGDITVRRLLSHTSGLQTVGVPNRAIPTIAETDSVANWVPKLASVPLDYHPGTRWAYSNSAAYEVLVRIAEVASNERFDAFLQRRLFDPLGMRDSGYGMQHRYPNRAMPLPRKLALNPCVAAGHFRGSAGLWTTAADYMRFARVLANVGSFGGTHVLRRDSVQLLVSDQAKGLFPGWRDIDGAGARMGLGVLVIVDPASAKVALPAGSFGWDGLGSRRFWVIPDEQVVLIMLMPSGDAERAHRDIERAVMDAIIH